MGVLSSPEFTKESIRAKVTATFERPNGGYVKTLRSSFSGNTLWVLHEIAREGGSNVERFIGCYRLSRYQGEWGYKDMDESVGPVYYDCPVSYLDEATAPMNEHAAEWRKSAREHGERKAAQRRKKPAVGETWSLQRCTIHHVKIFSVKPLRGSLHHVHYRISRRHLGERME